MLPVLSVYSGIGGLDLGAEAAGLKVFAAVDADPQALSLHLRVFGGRAFCTRTENAEIAELVRATGLPTDGSALLIGGPPCTAFSHAGFWIEAKRNGRDKQAHRVKDYLGFVRALRPRAFVMENVPGLLFQNHKTVLDRFEAACRDLGYNVSHALLNAADFGVPQRRRRLFVIGVKGKKQFCFTDGPFKQMPRTTRWAFAGLTAKTNPPEPDEELGGKYANLLGKVPPGSNYLVFTTKGGCQKPLFEWRSKYWSFLLKLDPNKPASTLPATRITNNGPFHWRNRHLRISELKRLQTFPDQHPTDVGAPGRTQIGNAVPPLLAAHLLWDLRCFLQNRQLPMPHALASALDPQAAAAEVCVALTKRK